MASDAKCEKCGREVVEYVNPTRVCDSRTHKECWDARECAAFCAGQAAAFREDAERMKSAAILWVESALACGVGDHDAASLCDARGMELDEQASISRKRAEEVSGG